MSSSPSDSAGSAASASIPSRSAAAHSSSGSPVGSAAATSSSRRVWERKRRQPPPEALLDPTGERAACERAEAESSGQLRGGQRAGQLQQRQRIAARLGHDPVPHSLVHRALDRLIQQVARIIVTQAPGHQLRESCQLLLLAGVAHREDQGNRLGQQPSRHERQRLQRRLVKPLRVIHHACQRLPFGGIRQQAQDSQPDQEAIRGLAGGEAERGAKGVPLRIGQVLQPVQHRRAQLLEPRERKLHLGLHSRRAGHAEPRRAPHRIVEECRLPDAGLTAHDQYLALTGPDPIEQLVEGLAFATPTPEGCVSGHLRHPFNARSNADR